jgi:lactoylglutathione lyase
MKNGTMKILLILGGDKMKFSFNHNNINVLDLEKSLAFYKKALGLVETRRKVAEDGSFILVFLGDEMTSHRLELTWLRDWEIPYNLGDNEFHLAFTTDDYEKAHDLHKEMGCICYENEKMGLYFIHDPDGYWIEILPEKR